jgi:hypothetical protein
MAEITALYIVPDHRPMIVTFEDELSNYQALVGGYIEALRLNDTTDIICNESAKLEGMLPNRMLQYGDFDGIEGNGSRDFDLVHGSFLVVGADNEQGVWKSLTPEQIEQYETRFRDIEIYLGQEIGMVR